ncbi:MAG: nucleoside transporter C-terminal domain-containing protein [Myxococcota bacterium]|nr:nucleoside transporter C-terminal domain-containing protein [Myxococcota bacterium]
MNRAHPMHRAIRVLARIGWTALLALLVLTMADVLSATASTSDKSANYEQVQPAGPTDNNASGPSTLKNGLRLADLRANAPETPFVSRLVSLLGIIVLLGIAWLLSRDRRNIRWRPVVWGIGLQVLFGLVVLSPAIGDVFFNVVNQSVATLMSFSEKGSEFLFQTVEAHEVTTIDPRSGEQTTNTYIGRMSPPLRTVAFWILPTIIFFSALMNIMYHLGIMQFLVRITATIMQRTMGTSGSESLSAAANIFVGQTEAPLVVKPFVEKMTRSELNAIMVGGFATVAGGVLAAYVGFLQKAIPDIAGHLVVASIMSAPAALAVAKILVPETEASETASGAELSVERPDTNLIEALARGTSDGLRLAVNVAAMLLSFVAMIALVNAMLRGASGIVGLELSLEGILGWGFAPLAWCMGVPWAEAGEVGRLLGEKLVLTELIAYVHLGENLTGPNPLSYRSAVIASYALCGFANFASIGIQIGGIGGIAPSRRAELAQLGILSMIGGTIAAMMTATIAGILL